MLSSKFNVYNIEWLDVVFANRNQTYGAYELRKNYSSRLTKALFLASTLFVTVVCSPLIYDYLEKEDEIITTDCTLDPPKDDLVKVIDVKLPAKKIEKITEPQGAANPIKIKTLRSVTPTVVTEDQVTEELPKMDELLNTIIGTENRDGAATSGNTATSEGKGGDGILSGNGKTEGTGEEIIGTELLEQMPEFPGGYAAFAKYLQRNLHYPHSASENGIMGRVFVNFIVEKDGSLTDITVSKGIGFGCDEEALRVLKKSPKWNAGIQNKQKVRVMFTIPIVFSMGE